MNTLYKESRTLELLTSYIANVAICPYYDFDNINYSLTL